MSDRLLLIAEKRDELSWLRQAAATMRRGFPDLIKESDSAARRIEAVLEKQLLDLTTPTLEKPQQESEER